MDDSLLYEDCPTYLSKRAVGGEGNCHSTLMIWLRILKNLLICNCNTLALINRWKSWLFFLPLLSFTCLPFYSLPFPSLPSPSLPFHLLPFAKVVLS